MDLRPRPATAAIAAAMGLVMLVVPGSVSADAPPVVVDVTLDDRNRAVVTWTKQTGQTSTNVKWTTDPRVSSYRDGSYGSPLTDCQSGLRANPAGDSQWLYGQSCKGNDVGDSTTRHVTSGEMQVGVYYFQVTVSGDTIHETGARVSYAPHYSTVFKLTVTPASRDKIAPETTISDGPSGTTTSTSAAFSFSASEPSTFDCRLDAEAFAACTSPKEYTGLAVGAHTFEVRATDAAGNSDATPAARSWTIAAPPSASAPPPKQQPGAQPKRLPRRNANTVEPPDDNETAACGKAIDRINYLNRELRKAVANWNFANGLNDNGQVQETRRNQLGRRIAALEKQLEAASNDAQRACGAEWGGVWRGQGTVVSSKCRTRNPAKVVLTIDQDLKKRTIDSLLRYELDLKCPRDAFPAVLRDGRLDLDLGRSRVTGKTVESETGDVFSLTKTGPDSLRGKIERTVAGIRVTLEFTAKRGS